MRRAVPLCVKRKMSLSGAENTVQRHWFSDNGSLGIYTGCGLKQRQTKAPIHHINSYRKEMVSSEHSVGIKYKNYIYSFFPERANSFAQGTKHKPTRKLGAKVLGVFVVFWTRSLCSLFMHQTYTRG